MSKFDIGDKVVCIDSSMLHHTVAELRKDMPQWVVEGKQYTIRGFHDNNGIVAGVLLEELHNPPRWFHLINRYQEPAFGLFRFRKLETAYTEVSIEQEEFITI
jgi:hypothetical protein